MARLSFGKRRRKINYDLIQEIVTWIVQIVLVCVLAFGIIWYFGLKISVIGDSMNPELNNGDVTLINRLVYDIRRPRRGEVIAFKANGNEDARYYIKRVIGLPGETIEYVDGKLQVDGKIIKEKYQTTKFEELGALEDKVVLGEDEFFVLGDDRQSMEDSRSDHIGYISRSEIEGKVWFKIFPMKHFGFVK